MMFNFQTMKLRERILWGYSVPLGLTILAASLVVGNAQRAEQQFQATEVGWQIVQDSDRLELLVYKRMAYIRSYLLTGDEVFVQRYEESVRAYKKLIEILEAEVTSSPQQMRHLEEVKRLGEEIYAYNQQLIALGQAGKLDQATKKLSQSNLLQLSDQLSETFQLLNTTEDKYQIQRQEQAQIAMQSLKLVAMAGTIAATILAVLIGFWLAGRISKQVNEIASAVASASSEIATTVEQQERSAVQQASSINETTTTMDELSNSTQQSAEQAALSASGAKDAISLAKVGSQTVSQTLAGMADLEAKVGAIAEQIMRLSDQTNQIGNITNLVSDLANQTNMLALNAAVEAVRAGEQGKGFAVVAAEIRKLADQSKQSAEKINTLVTDIQNAINVTVMVTDEGTKTVTQGLQIAETTAATFTGVANAINMISTNSQQIALTANQQAIAVQQVVEAMNLLNVAARETASGISQTKVSTHQLNQAALKLQATV